MEVMEVHAQSDTLCDEREEVARSSVIRRLEDYRLRIERPQDEAARNEVHQAIAQELSADQAGLAACAAAILNSRIRPRIGCEAWNTLVDVRDSASYQSSSTRATVVESSTCLRLIAQVTAHWGAQVIEHYGWIARGRTFLERLWAVAELYPTWDLAARRLSALLLFRHELVLMGKALGSAQSWQTVGNEAEKNNPRLLYSPITGSDLKNGIEWAESGRLDMAGFSLSSLNEAEMRVSHWASSTQETICLLDGSRLSDRPPAVQSSSMLARDKFGLLIREDASRRRPRRPPASPMSPAKRPRLDNASSEPSDSRKDSQSQPSSPDQDPIPSSPGSTEDDRGRGSPTLSVTSDSTEEEIPLEDKNANRTASLPSTTRSTPFSDDIQQRDLEHWPYGDPPVHTSWGPEESSLFVDGDQPQRPLPNGDLEGDVANTTSSPSTPASIEEDGMSEGTSSWTSAENDECSLCPHSPDCPVCRGTCNVGFVPRELAPMRADVMCSPEQTQQFLDMHEIADLVQQRQETDAKAGVQRSWSSSMRFASMYFDPDPTSRSTASKEHADLWCLDSRQFKQYSDSGISFDRPILVRNAVRDVGWHSMGTCVATMKRKVDGQSLVVRDPITHRTVDMDGDYFLDCLTSPHSALNALDLPAFIRGDKPEFTLLPQYRLLEDLIRAEAWDYATKQTSTLEIDLMGCTQFNLASGCGAFSGAHLDSLNGTWVCNFVGRKAWMFVPHHSLTPADLERLARDGDDWHPRGKARTVVLEPDDVFFMPPGYNIIHAVLTLEASIMEGAMVWDERCVTSVLRNMYWMANNQNSTNEPWPNNIQAILSRLDQAIFADADRFWPRGEVAEQMEQYKVASSALRSLPCACVTRCTKSCPCRVAYRRCTAECEQHEARKLVCMKDGE